MLKFFCFLKVTEKTEVKSRLANARYKKIQISSDSKTVSRFEDIFNFFENYTFLLMGSARHDIKFSYIRY